MSGGLMQIIAVGAQDLFLTGTPEITFFRSHHKQYTAFAVESVAQTFNGQVGWNKRVSSTISRNGDLINNMWLEINLTWSGEAGDDECWYPAEACLREVELEIGGQRIDRHTNDFFRVYDELYRNEQQKRAYKRMTNFSSEDMLGSTVTVTNNNSSAPKKLDITRRFYVPLLFWFCRDTSLSLPLIALQFHEVKLYFTFADARATITPGNDQPPLVAEDSALQATLFVDYIFLDAAERKNFASSNAELLITQLQYTTETIEPFQVGNGLSSTKNVRLSFNHPCSTLIWFVKGEKHGWYNVSRAIATVPDKNPTTADSLYNDMYAPVASAKLSINGHERSQARPGQFYSQVQPYQTLGARPQAGIYMYSFALDSSKVTQPNGTLNFSRVDNCTLSIDFKGMSDMAVPNDISSPDIMVNEGRYKLRTLVVMAVNWNVLRLVSGMAGLAFSN
ncbi:large eukaryotic DNA virus major capsid protein-domain-containing protein [Scenedesmus sp. NREL 46B-D3]|nr:large eukaryotic DNA virus major capsid protein-domain-containing protein [Scenedesmus sp. NREL 46B-D3]